jgi:hypothetical protein
MGSRGRCIRESFWIPCWRKRWVRSAADQHSCLHPCLLDPRQLQRCHAALSWRLIGALSPASCCQLRVLRLRACPSDDIDHPAGPPTQHDRSPQCPRQRHHGAYIRCAIPHLDASTHIPTHIPFPGRASSPPRTGAAPCRLTHTAFSARWVHLPSGRVYNTTYSAPKVPGKDDITGEPLSKRPDDTPVSRLGPLCV